MKHTNNIKDISKVVSSLLCGSQLDTFRVYSLILELGFLCLDAKEGLPKEIWVSLSGDLQFNSIPFTAIDSDTSTNFLDSRGSALTKIYQLIGRKVTAASVSDSGTLQIEIGGICLCMKADNDINFEEVWVVSSDSPNAMDNQSWYVALDDLGVVVARTPF